MKKNFFLFLMLVFAITAKAQTITELQSAIISSNSAVQAIHHYPEDIEDGKCHNVPTTQITVEGQTITIVETWTNYMHKKSQTVLTGALNGMQAEGTWKSSFSSGKWNYSFITGAGKWNKTNAPLKFGTFNEFQNLEFRIVSKSDLYDGFRACN